MKVQIVPHNPQWRAAFESEAKHVAAALGDNVLAIHHIGSTAIPGIYAKPVIDILVEVKNICEVDNKTWAMVSLGYEAKGEFGIASRRYFRKDNADGIRTHQIHTFAAGSDQAIRHLAFRDYLIAHPDDARRYSELKRDLVAKHSNSDTYIAGKNDFIEDIDRKAAVWRESFTAL